MIVRCKYAKHATENKFHNKSRTSGARIFKGGIMGKNEIEIIGYEPLVEDIKELINKKQFQVLKLINSETIKDIWNNNVMDL